MKRWLLFVASWFALGLAHAQSSPTSGLLNNILTQIEGQTATWMGRAATLALGLFVALAVIELAWTGAQLVLKKGELSELFASIMLKVVALGFFYTLIVKATEWIPLISQSFQSAGSTISGAPSVSLSPSGIIDLGLNTIKELWNKASQQIGEFGLTQLGSAIGLALTAVLSCIFLIVGFALLAIQLFIVKVEMAIVMAAGLLMLGFSGSRWTMNFAEKYLGYGVSVGAKFIIIALLAGFAQEFGSSMISTIQSAQNVRADMMFSMAGTGFIFTVASFMLPSMAGSVLSGAASLSLANTGAASGAIAGGMAAAGAGATGALAGGVAKVAGLAAKLATPASASGSIIGLSSAGGGGSGGAIGGLVKSAFGGLAGGGLAGRGGSGGAGGSAGGFGGGGSSSSFGGASRSSGTNTSGAGSASKSSGGAGDKKTSDAKTPLTGGTATATNANTARGGAGERPGFADPRAASGRSGESSDVSATATMGSERGYDAAEFERIAKQAQTPLMDYRDEERQREKEFRARASAGKFSRMMLKMSDKGGDLSKKAFDEARRKRRMMPSDGHTGAAPSIRMNLGGD